MKIHLFGLPISIHRRLKEESGGKWSGAVPDGHEFLPTPLNSNAIGPFSESELRELEKSVGEGFTHIVIPANREWNEIKRRFRFDCRIHLARLQQPLRDLTWHILRDALHARAGIDEIWLDKFSPKDLRHPLLLPPPVFATCVKTAEYWHHCDVYSTHRFAGAEQLLGDVEQKHRRPGDKVDDPGWRRTTAVLAR